VRCGEGVEAIEHTGGRVTGVRLAGGERIAADVVVSNADVLRAHELLGRRAPLRKLVPTMSAFLLYLGTDRPFDKLLHHTLLVGGGYRDFIRQVTRGDGVPETYSTYVHAPVAHGAGDGRDGGDSIYALLPGAEPARRRRRLGARGRRPARRRGRGLRDDLRADGLDASVVVEHRMTPSDFETSSARVRQRLRRRADPAPVGLLPPAQPRPADRGMYYVGGGTHPGRGDPRRAALAPR
jgi:phytoene desaturase